MRPAFTDIIGNDHLRARLCHDALEGSLSHAYIIEGAHGSGKHMLALRLAAAIACEHRATHSHPLPCLACPSCHKILSGNSPDVIYINRGDKSTLGIEEIRTLKSDIYIAPNDLSVKLYVIEDAHLMTIQAQNAFLLTLEEPPPYVLFLLLAESTATLLETIRSRAPTLRTEPILPEQIDTYLCATNSDAKRMAANSPSEFQEIIAAANGSIGRAITLLDPKLHRPLLERRSAAREFVRICNASHKGTAGLRFIMSLPQKRDELTEQCNEILLCLRDLLLCKQTEGAPLCFFSNREEACTLAYGFTTPALLSLCENIIRAIDRLRINANVRLTLTALASDCGFLQ